MRHLLSTILSLALLLLCTLAQAQVLSPKGRFRVDFSQGCPPYTVTVTTLNTTQTNLFYQLNYSSEPNNFRKDFLEPLVGNPQTFVIDQVDPKIRLIQATTNSDGSVDRDELVLSSYTPTAPVFNTYACSNNRASVEISNPVYDYYEVYFGTGNPAIRADASNNYTANSPTLPAGTHPVRVDGRYSNSQNNCGSASATVEVYASLPKPLWLGLQWDSQTQTVQLQYRLSPQVKYQLERLNPASGSYEILFPLKGNSADTSLEQSGLSSQYACYRIVALDVCGTNPVVSDEICTASWQLSAQDGYNQVNFQAHPAFSGTVELIRESGEVVASSNTTSGSFRDENVLCKQQYCYQLRLLPQAGSSAPSLSNPQCVISQSTRALPAVENITTVWLSGNRLVVKPDFPDFYKGLNLSLIDEGGKILARATGDSIIYPLNSEPTPACYAFSYSSGCSSQSAPPTPLCPLTLRNAAIEPDEFLPSWNTYVGYREGVSYYELQEVDATGEVMQSWNMGSSTSDASFPTFTLADNGRRFRVIAHPVDENLEASRSNIFTFELVMKGYFPNAFSPNGDDENDVFEIKGKFVTSASVWIYNRWGELIFFSGDKKVGWNGTHKGAAAPPGAYVYKAEVTTEDGKRSTLSGTVFLIH